MSAFYDTIRYLSYRWFVVLPQTYAKGVLIFLTVIFLVQCDAPKELTGDTFPDDGKLFLPAGFKSVVVVDSLPGRARHLAVNDNGDVYVKLRFPDRGGKGGNVALRDTD